MTVPQRIWDALDEAFTALEDERLEAAEAKLAEVAQEASELPELFYLRGQLALAKADPEAAREALARAVELDPKYADAHYALARAARELGDEDAARATDLLVWQLDQDADSALSEQETQDILQLIEGEAERVLAELPEPFRSALADVPILVEAQPHRDLVAQGFDPRALGLFDGPDHAARTGVDTPAAPTHIVLYWTNILDVAEDDEHLTEEVEITLLHEIAHYFGLDEEQVSALGLE